MLRSSRVTCESRAQRVELTERRALPNSDLPRFQEVIVINCFDVTDFSVRNVSQNYFFEANFPLRDYSRIFQQLLMG